MTFLQPQTAPLTTCSLDELDRRAKLAETCMNLALEQRCWAPLQRYRQEMLIVQAEIRRRLDALEDSPGHVGTRLGEQTDDRFCLAPEGDDAVGLA
ncbi:hypothetical protein [Saccharopolyspora hordei]|uniref:Uncharacterized protein n=1 Tax=Saccharopolyspora hordei TaxID=1838 RepID=A0A853ARX6_9PSEU|nr:hypothetical protein [Saccharopolyspora hordei]NYI84431.1 hypothetical protein [Saccharopolyspora hordei]